METEEGEKKRMGKKMGYCTKRSGQIRNTIWNVTKTEKCCDNGDYRVSIVFYMIHLLQNVTNVGDPNN